MDYDICPYCGASFGRYITRKTRCKACGNSAYYKYTPDNPVSRVMTKEQSDLAETQWRLHFEEEFLSRIAVVMGWQDRIKTREQLKHACVSVMLSKASSFNERANAARIYTTQIATTQLELESYTEAYLKFMLYEAIEQSKKLEIPLVQLWCYKEACPSCMRLRGKQFAINEALEETFWVPNKACEKYSIGEHCAFWAPVLASDL